MNPYQAMMMPQQQPPMPDPMMMQAQQPQPMMSMPQNPHEIMPYTFVQGEGDRFPQTQGLGQMQNIESDLREIDAQRATLDFEKDRAQYQSKMLGFARNEMQEHMQALKGMA